MAKAESPVQNPTSAMARPSENWEKYGHFIILIPWAIVICLILVLIVKNTF